MNTLKEQIINFDSDKQVITSTLNPLLLNKFGDRTLAVCFYKKSKS